MRILTIIATAMAFVIWFAGLITNDDHMEIYGMVALVLVVVWRISEKVDSLKSSIEERESK